MPLSSFLKNDELIQPFLDAETPVEDEDALIALLETARPLIDQVLRRKALLVSSQSDLGADLSSSVIMRLIEQLRKCKQSYNAGDETFSIRHFPALCQTIAATTVIEHLRLKYPRRTGLQNQLLYLVRTTKDRANNPLFAIWYDVEEQLCGLYAWEGSSLVLTKRHHLLKSDSLGAMHLVFRGEQASRIPLKKLLETLFRWLTRAAPFDDVVSTTALWRGIEDQSDLSLSYTVEDGNGEVSSLFEPVAPDILPEDKVIFRDYLKHLWKHIADLPPKHRAALLLNLCDAQGRGVVGFFPALGVASFHQIAQALELEIHEFARLWPQLPLDDQSIGQIYGCTPSVVSVWRSRARIRLANKMEDL